MASQRERNFRGSVQDGFMFVFSKTNMLFDTYVPSYQDLHLVLLLELLESYLNDTKVGHGDSKFPLTNTTSVAPFRIVSCLFSVQDFSLDKHVPSYKDFY